MVMEDEGTASLLRLEMELERLATSMTILLRGVELSVVTAVLFAEVLVVESDEDVELYLVEIADPII